MNLFDLFFGAGSALVEIFKLGFRPVEEDCLELTASQYESFFKQNGYTDERLFALLPSRRDKVKAFGSRFNEVQVVTDNDLRDFERAWQIVENYCSKAEGRIFENDEQKLLYVATQLPDVFTQGTRFEHVKRSHMRIVYPNGQK